MSEWDKMLNHEWYNANFDEKLIAARQKAQDLCFDFNHIRPSEIKKRQIILEKLFEQSVSTVEIVSPFICDYGTLLEFGKNVFINSNCYFMDGGTIKIGNHVFIGPYCGFYTANHPINMTKRNSGLEKADAIIIEDGVWCGANVSVMPGVTIGQGAVIGAGAIVTKDIPPFSIAVGSPAKVIRKIVE